MNKKILFGHQSVGENIIDGIRAHHPDIIVLNEIDSRNANPFGITHTRIGKNHDAYSKLDSFYRIVTETGQNYDVAMMKLCYVDIKSKTDIRSLFDAYVALINELQQAYPRLRFVHITVPLRGIRLGLRSRIKLMTGGTIPVVEDNIRRHQYNELVRAHFDSSSSVFDLAAIESLAPNGHRNLISINGQQVPALLNRYSNDGGHLNSHGQAVVARQFVHFLTQV